MAEGWLRHLCGDSIQAKSAGFESGALNPLAVEVMAEVGIDISQHRTKTVFDLFKAGEFFGYVIGLCDEAMFEKCPVFPAPVQRINWSIPKPAKSGGSREEQLQQMREVRDLIREQVEEWCATQCELQAS